jgi:thymidylate kinase
MGARLQHAHEVLVPALRSGTAVVCDRYIYSAAAHLLARGYSHEPWFLDLSTHLPSPTVSFHPTAPLDVLLARLAERGNGPDAQVEDGFFATLHEAYGSVARSNDLIPLDTTDEFDSTLERIDGQIDTAVERGVRRRPHS